MILIQRLISNSSRLPVGQQVVLHAERRMFLKRRWRGFAEDGTEFGFDLESRLVDGGVVHHADGKDYVVRQTPEVVFRIPYHSPAEAAFIAWKTGNLHMPAQILEDSILVLHDEAMRQLIEREGWQHSEPEVLFNPLKAVPHA